MTHTRYTYDERGHLASTTNPLGHITHYEFDVLERLIRETDAYGNRRTMGYDGEHQLIRETLPVDAFGVMNMMPLEMCFEPLTRWVM